MYIYKHHSPVSYIKCYTIPGENFKTFIILSRFNSQDVKHWPVSIRVNLPSLHFTTNIPWFIVLHALILNIKWTTSLGTTAVGYTLRCFCWLAPQTSFCKFTKRSRSSEVADFKQYRAFTGCFAELLTCTVRFFITMFIIYDLFTYFCITLRSWHSAFWHYTDHIFWSFHTFFSFCSNKKARSCNDNLLS